MCAKITAQEVHLKIELTFELSVTSCFISVNFPVVSGGFALLTAGAIAATSSITAITAPVVAAPIVAAPIVAAPVVAAPIAAAPVVAAPLIPGVAPPLAALGLIGIVTLHAILTVNRMHSFKSGNLFGDV